MDIIRHNHVLLLQQWFIFVLITTDSHVISFGKRRFRFVQNVMSFGHPLGFCRHPHWWPPIETTLKSLTAVELVSEKAPPGQVLSSPFIVQWRSICRGHTLNRFVRWQLKRMHSTSGYLRRRLREKKTMTVNKLQANVWEVACWQLRIHSYEHHVP